MVYINTSNIMVEISISVLLQFKCLYAFNVQVKSSDAPRLKHEKELKPASMRVKDAAEALLSCVLSQVSFYCPLGHVFICMYGFV